MACTVDRIADAQSLRVVIIRPSGRIVVQAYRALADLDDIDVMSQREVVEPEFDRDPRDGFAQIVGRLGFLDRATEPFGRRQHVHRASSRSRATPQVAPTPAIGPSFAVHFDGSSRYRSAIATQYPYYSLRLNANARLRAFHCAIGIGG